MKKLVAVAVIALVAICMGPLSFADSSSGNENTPMKNLQNGGENLSTGVVNVMDSTSSEMAKAKGPGEQATAFVAGTAIATQKTLHQLGAGVIDVLTFWIPKKEPLIKSDK